MATKSKECLEAVGSMLKESAPEPDFATFSQKSGDDRLTRSNCREARGAAKSTACRAFSKSDQKQHEA